MKNQYKIAVLLPTRGRTDALSRSVMSLVNRCVDPESVHIVFGFDDDDQIGKSHFTDSLQPWLDTKKVTYTAMEFEPLGYDRLNEYLNSMAHEVSADWFFFWNDDALMETTGWEKKIYDHTGEFKLLAVHTHKDHPYSIFPIVPKAWFDKLGYLSPHPLTDAWLSQVAYKLDIWERIDVYVTHDRFDLTGNNNDSTFQEREILEGNPNNPRDFHNLRWIALRFQEAEILSEYLTEQGIDISFWKGIKAGTQDPWEKLKENDINKQMAHFSISTKMLGAQ